MASKGVNKVILLGHVGQDPELKHGQNANAVCKISIATSESWKDRDSGNKMDRTEWHKVVFFGKLAEVVAQYVKKGSKIYIEGSLRTNMYEKNGDKHYSTDILATSMQMLDSKPAQSDTGDYQKVKDGSVAYAPATNDFDEDLPF